MFYFRSSCPRGGEHSEPSRGRDRRPTIVCGLVRSSGRHALAAIRSNPVIRRFAGLRAAGKLKVTIVACMRKLLAILNAMVREGITWDQLKLVRNH